MLAPQRPVIVAIGGSDSAGLAGIQMDSRSADALGVHAATVVTTVTAQTNAGVLLAEPVSDSGLAEQLAAAAALSPKAIKIGVVASASQLAMIQQFILSQAVPVIWDPVKVSTSGSELTGLTMAELRKALLPKVTLVTPNLLELAAWQPADEVITAAQALLAEGANALLVKGGHADDACCQDLFLSQDFQFWLSSPRQATLHTRGTGCALASAVASAIALGYPLDDAVVIGKAAINQGLRQAQALAGNLKGCVRISHFPSTQQDMPHLTLQAGGPEPPVFAACAQTPLGLYPIVDRASWLARLLPLGVSTVQLRIKDLQGAALEQEIKAAITLAEQYQCRLFINDYWQLAIEFGAYGVHLGQEDLLDANVDAIARAGLRLGVSTHCHREVARALALQPSYIACGPVYPTTTKIMPWQPQGLAGLRYWLRLLSDYPLVAIGGINAQRINGVAATGVSGIALITAITQAVDPEQACRDLQRLCASQ